MKVLNYLEAIIVGIVMWPIAIIIACGLVEIYAREYKDMTYYLMVPPLAMYALPLSIKKAYQEAKK